MKKICVLTATRAEYGLLKPLIRKLLLIPDFDIHVVVTGAHLSSEFGSTYREIENDGIKIDEKIEILTKDDRPSDISKSMGTAMIKFADYFQELEPDLLIVLGDRYETLAVCCTAVNQRIRIAHLYGGESTEGAVDESFRHAITKLSHLHFTSTDKYRQRIIQMGEQPDNVYNVGALGVENILHEKLINKNDLESLIGMKLDKPYAVVTFHPVTLENNSAEEQMKAILDVCRRHQEMRFIFTKANADANGRIINKMIDEYVQTDHNAVVFASLGSVKYLSVMKYCSVVMGNSSSGLIEAPSFGIPTINIGDRQKGRVQADSVINCKPITKEINRALSVALSDEFKIKARKTVNPYGDGDTSDKIVSILNDRILNNIINIQKRFHDLDSQNP